MKGYFVSDLSNIEYKSPIVFKLLGSWLLIFTLYKPQPGYAKLIQGIVDKICIIDALPLSNQDLIIRLY